MTEELAELCVTNLIFIKAVILHRDTSQSLFQNNFWLRVIFSVGKMSSKLILVCILFNISTYAEGAAIKARASPNNRPVIGIISQELSKTLLPPSIKGSSYIAASYIKYIESAGGRAVPVLTNFTSEQLKEVFRSVNGILIPGGGSHIPTSGYFKNAKALFEMAIAANSQGDYFPIWGTCLGFQSLHIMVDESTVISEANAVDIALPLNFTQAAYNSRLFGKQSNQMMQIFAKEPVTYNFHEKCISRATFEGSSKLKSFFDVLSYNKDRDGKEFVSTTEGRKYPIYGTQWHPEKNTFEWNTSLKMPHSQDAIQASQAVADFFVNEARKSNHRFVSEEKEQEYLIYRYRPIFTPGGHFEQVYVF